MLKSLIIGIATLAALNSSPLQAQSSVRVQGVTFYGSPTYYTTTEGTYDVHFEAELPWGTKVFLMYGFGGSITATSGNQEAIEWADQSEIELKAYAPFAWKTTVVKTLHSRSQNRVLKSMSFAFRIELPDGKVSYDNGGISSWGFYELNVYPIRQYSPGQSYPGEKESMRLSRIERD